MARRREPSVDECLALMRKRDPQLAEEGFHSLRPRANEFLPRLIEMFESEQSRPMRCWLLELIGEARAEEAFPLLCEQALSDDESLCSWGIIGLRLLNSAASRKFFVRA